MLINHHNKSKLPNNILPTTGTNLLNLVHQQPTIKQKKNTKFPNNLPLNAKLPYCVDQTINLPEKSQVSYGKKLKKNKKMQNIKKIVSVPYRTG